MMSNSIRTEFLDVTGGPIGLERCQLPSRTSSLTWCLTQRRGLGFKMARYNIGGGFLPPQEKASFFRFTPGG